MSEPEQDPKQDLTLSAYNYVPPVHATGNQDVGAARDAAQAASLELRIKELEQRLAASVPAPVRVLTPEERARAALDARGAGKGVDERFAELYEHLDTVARQVGI